MTLGLLLHMCERRGGTVHTPVSVREAPGGVVRVLSPRPFPPGIEAHFVTGGTTSAVRVSRCDRLPTGRFAISLAVQPSVPLSWDGG